MDQADIALRVARGLGRAAIRLGATYAQYRPSDPTAPLGGPAVASILGVFDPDPRLGLMTTDLRHETFGTLIGDFSTLETGDYLIGADRWFIFHMEPLRPPTCARCNRAISVVADAPGIVSGDASYGGRTRLGRVIIAAGWPASILAKPRTEPDSTKLPSDARSSYFEILLPAMLGVQLANGVVVIDDTGADYVISSAELSETGWRLSAGLIGT